MAWNGANVIFMGESKTIYVDGYCSGNPGPCGCRGIMEGKEIFRYEAGYGTNNLAEFFAIVSAVKYANDNNFNAYIYSDSMCAIGWVKKGVVSSGFVHEKTQSALGLLTPERMRRVQINYWNTKKRGEIPADYGRKK